MPAHREYTRICTVDMLSIPVSVEVVFVVDSYGMYIKDTFGPTGKRIHDQLNGPVAMRNPRVQLAANGELQWYGVCAMDDIYAEIDYAIQKGEYE